METNETFDKTSKYLFMRQTLQVMISNTGTLKSEHIFGKLFFAGSVQQEEVVPDLLVFSPKLSNLKLEPDVFLFQKLGPDGDLLLLGPPSIPRSFGGLVVLPPAFPVGAVLLLRRRTA